MSDLVSMKCIPCSGEEPALDDQQIQTFHKQVPGWKVVERDGEKRLQRAFDFKDFAEALQFTDRVGALAQAEDHHPLITTEWGKTTVTWWTHKIHGLHRNDFVMAAKTDQAYQR